MISLTALFGVSPVLMRLARNSRSVRRPPRRSMQVSSSPRSVRCLDGSFFSEPSLGAGSSSTSASRCVMTNFLATSGLQSESEIWRKTRSGSALDRDLLNATSFVRKMTCATFVVVSRAALASVSSAPHDGISGQLTILQACRRQCHLPGSYARSCQSQRSVCARDEPPTSHRPPNGHLCRPCAGDQERFASAPW